MLSLYRTFVTPHVEYCISDWNPRYKKDKELIEKVQKRFTKMITRKEKPINKDYTVCSYGHLKREGTDRILLRFLRCVTVCRGLNYMSSLL